uniref:Uncharacterized protein n=1 Tax=Candidatus Kentrum sp. LPFa TaxID=2126335 RepID=A0A450VZR5_9GAMM|nr:MAG: hypothetical protein BECKLPF1236B_GA0070989_101317 [Candidatus Kentron sp. LPFa]
MARRFVLISWILNIFRGLRENIQDIAAFIAVISFFTALMGFIIQFDVLGDYSRVLCEWRISKDEYSMLTDSARLETDGQSRAKPMILQPSPTLSSAERTIGTDATDSKDNRSLNDDGFGDASITSLKENDSVTAVPEYLAGKCKDVPEGIYLWIATRKYNNQFYHPQPGPISNGCDNEWEGVAYIGESVDRNVGDKFEIHLIGTGVEGNIIIRNYITRENHIHKWPGMFWLPIDSITYRKLTVTRK